MLTTGIPSIWLKSNTVLWTLASMRASCLIESGMPGNHTQTIQHPGLRWNTVLTGSPSRESLSCCWWCFLDGDVHLQLSLAVGSTFHYPLICSCNSYMLAANLAVKHSYCFSINSFWIPHEPPPNCPTDQVNFLDILRFLLCCIVVSCEFLSPLLCCIVYCLLFVIW